MNDVLDFADQLISDGALGSRIVAAWLPGNRGTLPFGPVDVEALCRFASPADALSIRLDFFGKKVARAAYLDAGGFYDFGRISRLHAGGATLIANQAHKGSGPMRRLKTRLEQRLQCHVGINCYLTPTRARGFARHVDSHDVIIVQLQGRKRWELCARAQRVRGDYSMEGMPADVPCDERTLEPGDLLYIPAGFVHAARTIDGPTSIHLTIGFAPPTWETLLTAWVAAAASGDDSLHGQVPLRAVRAPEGDPGLESAARDALARVGASPLGGAYRGLFEHAQASADDAAPIATDTAADVPLSETRLRKTPGTVATMFAGVLTLTAHGRRLELRRECAAAWSEIVRRETLRPRDLTGMVSQGHEALFCYFLLNNGLLERADPARA